VPSEITLLHHGAIPKPVPVTFDDLLSSQYDCRLVTVHAVVRAADMVVDKPAPALITRLWLVTEGGRFEAEVDNSDSSLLKGLLDAEVEITGVAAGRFDDKMQLAGIILFVPTLAQMRILKHAGESPWTLPVTPMDKIITGYHVNNLSKRLHVHGVITYFQPGLSIVLQDGSKSLWIQTRTHDPLRIGDLAEATGFPDLRGRLLNLIDGEIQDDHIQAPITPFPATWHQLAFWDSNTPNGHQNDLVSIEGTVVTEVREATADLYVLTSDGQQLTAIYRHPPTPLALPPMKQIPLGSKIRVTGICTRTDPESVFNTFREVPFDIFLRTSDDITVIAGPSMLNIRNLIIIVGLLLIVIFAVGARGWTLDRKVRQKTAALATRIEAEAALERRRARILEDINGDRAINEILEEITEMVSFLLKGAPCWFQIADGARLGDCPQEVEKLRIVTREIPTRSGPPLGSLFAAFDPLTQPSASESEALSTGAALAALAIETRKLYSDLRRRSEYDLLTDIPNRFAMEKFMEMRLDEARQSKGSMGLIYIDLDKFKPINDTYGHHAGDLYLQEVALRMSRQLLGGDMMARLGGDEFAALVALQHGRSDLDRIIARLESCFNEPFNIEGHIIKGSASIGIALYPEDGVTKDNLLSAADAAMYRTKNAKKLCA
jgi:diguanylate cyclase (GGDEF)-like protein